MTDLTKSPLLTGRASNKPSTRTVVPVGLAMGRRLANLRVSHAIIGFNNINIYTIGEIIDMNELIQDIPSISLKRK